MDGEFLYEVLELTKEENWKGVLKLNDESDKIEARNLLWVWPSEDNLRFIKDTVSNLNCVGIISIGCGCGLLEWIIEKSTGLPLLGYEVNREWWESKYSPPTFINLKYSKQPPDETTLDPEYALVFCYFNSGQAFRDYLRVYNGRVVIIIGPGEDLKQDMPKIAL
ncbi:unnamed protein product [Acanthoscelides obtectus]|uniref:Uncharacterized protein n=1 Tax=Acanthoscelides obtectus TaxID=200917 RepID=A0A9P0LL49_ACAOB|nr:unnamed protein product [Acanthoscelides obtectus]CAK1650265.1 hypothetical protein AOBTE_LOCUS16722 [Acanthoscelides obtectus]